MGSSIVEFASVLLSTVKAMVVAVELLMLAQ